jgi:hypothetical protein
MPPICISQSTSASGETAHGLVIGDAVFVQAAALGPRLEDGDVMAVHRQPVRAGSPAGPAPTTATVLPVAAARS